MDERSALGADLAAADHAVALTGAGVSTASGVPDFRSEGGVWERFSQADFTGVRLAREPGAFWVDWLDLHEAMLEDSVAPNPAHEALAALERDGVLETLVTQNVDGLHRAAGSESIVHLHGTGATARCTDCGAEIPVEAAADRVAEGESPPRCRDCDGWLRPDTVLFGEGLPEDALRAARTAVETCDVLLVVGTSLTVEPAASLPDLAVDWGATVAEFNVEGTRISADADYVFRESAAESLPAVVDAYRSANEQ